MGTNYRITLDKSSKKFECPQCGKKRFVRYIDSANRKYINDNVGRCDRESSCSYHLTPKEYFVKNPELKIDNEMSLDIIQRSRSIDSISENFVNKSLRYFESNKFIIWLRSLFNHEYVNRAIKVYKIGSSKHWKGSTVFWQIDHDSKVRQAKVMLYNERSGKRNKSTGAYFAGKMILKRQGNKDPNLVQCFFGQHLIITYPDIDIIGIVESEKTAILMTIFSWIGIAPKYIYLATGGKNGCRWHLSKVHDFFRNYKIVIFPDLGAYEDWNYKSKFLMSDKVIVSDLLATHASEEEKSAGFDIADYYLRLWNDKRCEQSKISPPNVKSSKELKLEYLGKINPMIYTIMEELNLEIA